MEFSVTMSIRTPNHSKRRIIMKKLSVVALFAFMAIFVFSQSQALAAQKAHCTCKGSQQLNGQVKSPNCGNGFAGGNSNQVKYPDESELKDYLSSYVLDNYFRAMDGCSSGFPLMFCQQWDQYHSGWSCYREK
jgi:hypothetical protein